MLARIEKRGRPPKRGERKSNGRLQPEPEPMSTVYLQRLIQNAKAIASDQRIITELGRLVWRRTLTTVQGAAGYRVAEIYGQFERSQGMPARTSRSPSYDGSFRGMGPLLDDDWVATAKETWWKLQRRMPHFEVGQAIERLCVDDQSINPMLYERVRRGLDIIAQEFGISPNKGNVPLHFNKHDDDTPLRRVTGR